MGPMTQTFEAVQPWELQKMASMGLVRDERLLAWAIRSGLPVDDRLSASMVFHGVPLPDDAPISSRVVEAAVAGGRDIDYVASLMEKCSSMKLDSVSLARIAVRRGNQSFLRWVVLHSDDDPRCGEILDALYSYKYEEGDDIYGCVYHTLHNGQLGRLDISRILMAASHGNIYLIDRILRSVYVPGRVLEALARDLHRFGETIQEGLVHLLCEHANSSLTMLDCMMIASNMPASSHLKRLFGRERGKLAAAYDLAYSQVIAI